MTDWKGGEPVIIEPFSTFWFECCDCGLSHLFLFKINEDGNIEMRAYRDDHTTAKGNEKRSRRQRRATIEALGGKLE